MKIAGAVVLYNSPMECLQKVNTYLPQVNTLFAVDNSDRKNYDLVKAIKQLPSVVYTDNCGNKGIAHALNVAAKQAIVEGNDYLLTMDDDSSVPNFMIEEMTKFIQNHSNPLSIGIVSVAHLPATFRSKVPNPVLYTMTSGNLINLKAYQSIGPFREDFFIDHVDHDFCLRLVNVGYEIIELPSVCINHPVGERKEKWGITYVSRQPVRQYYMVRNGLIVAWENRNKHPIFIYKMLKLLIKEWLKVIFGETNRKQRVLCLLKGMRDGLLRKTGKV